MPRAAHVIRIAAPPDAVWKVLANPVRAPDWAYGVKRVEFVTDARTGVGAQWRETTVLGPVVIVRLVEVTQADGPRAYATESVTRPHVETRFSLEEEPVDGASGTRLALDMEYEMPLGVAGRAAEPAIGEWFGGTLLRRSAERLKRVVEREAGVPRRAPPGEATAPEAHADAASEGAAARPAGEAGDETAAARSTGAKEAP